MYLSVRGRWPRVGMVVHPDKIPRKKSKAKNRPDGCHYYLYPLLPSTKPSSWKTSPAEIRRLHDVQGKTAALEPTFDVDSLAHLQNNVARKTNDTLVHYNYYFRLCHIDPWKLMFPFDVSTSYISSV